MTEQKTVTASEWASAGAPRPLPLPSGVTIMVRPRSSLAMALQGQGVFDLIKASVKAHIPDAELDEKEEALMKDGDNAAEQAQSMINTVIDHVVSPRVVLKNAGPDEILFSKISDADLFTIYFDATGQSVKIGGLTGTVDKFREERRIPRQRTGGKNVRPKTKRAAG